MRTSLDVFDDKKFFSKLIRESALKIWSANFGTFWELSSKRHKSTQTSFYLRYSLELKKDRMMFVSTCVACWKAPSVYTLYISIKDQLSNYFIILLDIFIFIFLCKTKNTVLLYNQESMYILYIYTLDKRFPHIHILLLEMQNIKMLLKNYKTTIILKYIYIAL